LEFATEGGGQSDQSALIQSRKIFLKRLTSRGDVFAPFCWLFSSVFWRTNGTVSMHRNVEGFPTLCPWTKTWLKPRCPPRIPTVERTPCDDSPLGARLKIRLITTTWFARPFGRHISSAALKECPANQCD